MNRYYDTAMADAPVGRRVELHPACDAWVMGDRYGEVVKHGRKYLHVKMDVSQRTLKMTPNLTRLVE